MVPFPLPLPGAQGDFCLILLWEPGPGPGGKTHSNVGVSPWLGPSRVFNSKTFLYWTSSSYNSGFATPEQVSAAVSTDESLLQWAMTSCIHLTASMMLGQQFALCPCLSYGSKSYLSFRLFSFDLVRIERWLLSSLHMEPENYFNNTPEIGKQVPFYPDSWWLYQFNLILSPSFSFLSEEAHIFLPFRTIVKSSPTTYLYFNHNKYSNFLSGKPPFLTSSPDPPLLHTSPIQVKSVTFPY